MFNWAAATMAHLFDWVAGTTRVERLASVFSVPPGPYKGALVEKAKMLKVGWGGLPVRGWVEVCVLLLFLQL